MTDLVRKWLLGAEFVLLFFGIPLFMFFDTRFSLPSVVLLPLLVFVVVVMRYRTEFKWKELIYFKLSRENLRRDAIILASCALAIFMIVILLMPEKLLNLPRGNTFIWLALGAFYPVFSAYPQEILFRTFIYRRYPRIFTRKWMFITASGVTFSFAHIMYYHPISMILTLVGGLYLGSAYLRTRSVLYTAILHAILGMLVFTLGLGEYFWLEMYDYL